MYSSPFKSIIVLQSLLLIVCGCGQKSNNQPDGKPDVPEADIKVSAKQFADEFTKDAATATQKYRKKTIELTSVVEGVGRDFKRRAQLSLKGTEKEPIGCTTVDAIPWRKAHPGQTVTIRGKLPERLTVYPPELIDCHIVEVEGDRLPEMTADELAGEFKTNWDGAVKKYFQKYVIVKGDIVELDPGTKTKATSLVLRHSHSFKLTCSFGINQTAEPRSLKTGQTVRVLGTVSPSLSEGPINIGFCVLYPK